MISDSRRPPVIVTTLVRGRRATPGATPGTTLSRAQRRANWLFLACALAALGASGVLIAMTGHSQIAAAVGLTQPIADPPAQVDTPADFSNPLRRP